MLSAIAGGQPPELLPRTAPGAELLLAGYEDLSPDFSEWLATTRRLAQNRLLRSLEAAYQNTALPSPARRRLAESAQHLDPLHEGACRTVMQLATEAGEVGVALRAYAALYDAMGLQLDMEPSEPTQALVAEIKMGRMAPPQPAAAPPMPPSAVAALSSEVSGRVPVVAVLPLLPVGSEEMTGWIADAIAEDVVRVLASLREPMVISSNSTWRLRGPARVERDSETPGCRLPRIG